MLSIFPKRVKIRSLTLVLALLATGVAPATPWAADLIPFKQLLPLVDIAPPAGFTVSEPPNGSTSQTPVALSEARIAFKSGDDKSIEISIMDGLVASAAIAQAVEMESSEEYIKPLEISGIKGNENFRFQDMEGELTLVVANRFLVSVRGLGLPDNNVLKSLAATLDFARLTEMSK